MKAVFVRDNNDIANRGLYFYLYDKYSKKNPTIFYRDSTSFGKLSNDAGLGDITPHDVRLVVLPGYTPDDSFLTEKDANHLLEYVSKGGGLYAVCDSVLQVVNIGVKFFKDEKGKLFFGTRKSESIGNGLLGDGIRTASFSGEYDASSCYREVRLAGGAKTRFAYYNGPSLTVCRQEMARGGVKILARIVKKTYGPDIDRPQGVGFFDILHVKLGEGDIVLQCSHIEAPLDYRFRYSRPQGDECKDKFKEQIELYRRYVKRFERTNARLRDHIYEGIFGLER
ncbi:MAG: hypothetical protein LBL52_00600 [Rickettsiales bacterium]|jgi:glutamine amidotransferase-like uncharacterized protein|nr:hypothetical protein [Rickettsiales bacterium]